MESVEFTVHGEDVSELPSAIDGFPENKRADYGGDGFAVIVTEQYFFRTSSNLLTTTIFELVDDTTCTVRIVVGGGGIGVLQIDWWSESSEATKIVRKIEDFCEERNLEIERG